MQIKDFIFASSVSEAYSLLKKYGDSAYLIAGGTSTFFVHSNKSKIAIDINRIPIKGIVNKKNSFKIGGTTTINEIMNYKDEGWVLNRVALTFVNQHVRNISTIAGNVSRVFYWSDFPVALRVLDGTINVTDSSSKKIKISEAFLNRAVHTKVFNNVILEYLEIPKLLKGMGFGYVKENRTFGAFSAATAAAFVIVKNGVISDIRISVGAALPFPMRLFEIENSLKGKKSDCNCVNEINFDKLDKYKLQPREGMSLEYCKQLLKVKIKDVICEAINEANGVTDD